MRGLFHGLTRSLELRLFVPLAVVIALVLTAHAVLGFRSIEERVHRFVEADVERSSRLIDSATHDGMLLNRLDEVQKTLERLGASPEFTGIRVFSKDGRVVLSADPEERGRRVLMEDEACMACHIGGEPEGEAVLAHRNLLIDRGGHEARRRLTVIENEASCATAMCHVHPADQPVLGVLDVEMSMAPFQQAVSGARGGLIGTTLALVVLSGAVAAVFIRRVVHAPVARLHEGTRRIAEGDLDTRIEVRGRDELAGLAEAFNGMVADLRAARDELSEWSRTLEERVEAKTAELDRTREQMVRVETMASLGKLSATVAHELNNPISGILTYARLIKRELSEQELDPEVRDELERRLTLIDKECARCGGIVRNMLAFSRGRGSKMARTDVNEVVERALMLVRHHLEMRRIRLASEYLEGDPVIVADADQIQQALLALLMNAIEAMPEDGGGTLGVRLAGGESAVSLFVSDTGGGIPEEALPRIFEPFYSTKGDQSGVGLGLAVVYGIVRGHDGTIDVRSEPGRGTTFRVDLPRVPSGGGSVEPKAAVGETERSAGA